MFSSVIFAEVSIFYVVYQEHIYVLKQLTLFILCQIIQTTYLPLLQALSIILKDCSSASKSCTHIVERKSLIRSLKFTLPDAYNRNHNINLGECTSSV